MSKEHPLRVWRHSQEPRKTLVDLANDVGVTPSHLSEIENWNNEPSLDLLSRLHRVTGIEMSCFVRGIKPTECTS
jgi:transcriptional regulator with XRE-family HTH domain